MMDALAVLVPAVLGGAAAAAVYLGLLWWHTRRLVETRFPGVATVVGAGLRLALVPAVLWWVGGDSPARLLAALAGFVVVRALALRRVRGRLTARTGGAA